MSTPTSRPTSIASRLFAPEPSAAGFRLLAAAVALTDSGPVSVLTSTVPPGTRPSPLAEGISVSRWPVLRAADGAVRGYLPYASFDVPLVLRLLAQRRQGAVLVEPPPTTGAAARVALAVRRTPYVYYAADVVSTAAAGAGYPRAVVALSRAVERFALRGAAAVVAVNQHVVDEVVALGVPRSRVHLVGNGVDTSVFSPVGPLTPPPGVRAGSPYFVYAGSMNDLHGAHVFVEAFVQVIERRPDARLVMIGRGTQSDAIRRRGEELLGEAFVFEDTLPGHEVAGRLRGAVAGLASVRPDGGYTMALATKAIATAATGAPVVFAGSGTTTHVIEEGALGWAVPWESAAVAQAMLDALEAAPDDAVHRSERAAWVQHNASLAGVGHRVAEVVRSVARPLA
ncbi:glycosyltransferase [Oerskovia turbata]|nr:glycosyltransferase [Oerskovia turbata]